MGFDQVFMNPEKNATRISPFQYSRRIGTVTWLVPAHLFSRDRKRKIEPAEIASADGKL
ncbi:MAG: hypothetical protein GY866_28655 [Proteobacteria bacterium]|nr:hypothetical protein [Pseudomonadota bacterium]